MLQYCLHPAHRSGSVPWFLTDTPQRYCPQHRASEKPRLRYANGTWQKVP